MIDFRCGRCAATFRVDDMLAGRQCKCRSCGNDMMVPTLSPTPSPPIMYAQSMAPYLPPAGISAGEDKTGRTCAILSVVFGAVAFIFCPIVFGLAGIVLGIIAIVRCREKGLAITGLVVSVVGTIAGVIIGAIVGAAAFSR